MDDPLFQVRKFFQTQHCPLCGSPFQPEGVQMEDRQEALLVVKISCLSCEQQVGIALVRLGEISFISPELTPSEEKKFAMMGPITDQEVLGAKQFISHLGAGWSRRLPPIAIDPPPEED